MLGVIRGITIILLIGGLTVQAKAIKPISFYVAVNGNDSWSGTLSAPNAKRADGPFATIEAARDAIRSLRRKEKGLKSPITVYIRGGVYYLDEPIEFFPKDSGTEECPITYRAYRGEKPVLSGGRPISGWREETVKGKKMWVADLPEAREGRRWFRQLFVNDERRPRPRLPKEGFFDLAGLLPENAEDPWNKGQDSARFADGDIKNWKNLNNVELVALHFWVDSHLPIAAVDEANHVVSFTKKSVFRLTVNHSEIPAPYYVENVFEALDTPGEWYLDAPAGKLYHLPKPGERIENCVFVAPRLSQVIRLVSDEKSPVAHINFRGISFKHTEWNLPPESAGEGQAAMNVPGAIFLQGAESCVISDCEIAHIGNYAIELGRGCQSITIARNKIYDMGAGGIKVGHGSSLTTVSDNEIGDGGKIFHSAIGVWVGNSGRNRVTHNHIHHLHYSGISVGWTWGYGPSNAIGNEISYNYIHNIGQGWLSDMGAIYTLGISPGTVLRRNLIHDCTARTYGGWGIYLDEGSTNIRVENNIVYRTKTGGFHQHYGKDNLIQNNIFAFAKEHQIMRSRKEDHNSFSFRRNIVYWDEGVLLGSVWDDDKYLLDSNVYWDASGRPIDFLGQSLEQWRAKGMDAHSIIADPKFKDPKNGDFSLSPVSPAIALGFKPIDLKDVGPRK